MKRIICLLLALLTAALPLSALALPQEAASPDQLPETNADGFLDAGADPVYYKDHAEGFWYYVSDTLRVEITRVKSGDANLTYCVADIRTAPGENLYTVTWNTEKYGRTNGLPQDMAQDAHSVFAMSGDFYSYRVKNDRYPGNIVRDGKVIYNKSYSKMVHATPNLATMGFWADGTAEVNEAWEKSAKAYVKEGAQTVVAFGPLLIRDGAVQDLSDKAYAHLEPRSCLGMVEAGHYIALLCEGRKSFSDGADLATCAHILADLGCTAAINLDGGNSAAMLFLGESVLMNERGGVEDNDRALPDILAFGAY